MEENLKEDESLEMSPGIMIAPGGTITITVGELVSDPIPGPISLEALQETLILMEKEAKRLEVMQGKRKFDEPGT